MGMLNIFVFAIMFSLLFAIATYTCTTTAGVQTCGSQYSSPMLTIIQTGGLNLTSTFSNFFTGANALQVAGLGATILLGTQFFPNPWLIFFPVAAYLITWLVFPTSIFNAANLGIVDPNATLLLNALQILLQVAFALYLMSWFKGQEAVQ